MAAYSLGPRSLTELRRFARAVFVSLPGAETSDRSSARSLLSHPLGPGSSASREGAAPWPGAAAGALGSHPEGQAAEQDSLQPLVFISPSPPQNWTRGRFQNFPWHRGSLLPPPLTA